MNHHRSQLLRALLTTVDDSGPQQFVAVTGLTGQTIGQAVRSQHFGLTSVPPAGAEGLMLALGGGHDRHHALGLEHPKYRPINTPSGGTVLYDAYGDAVSIVQANLKIVHGSQIVLQVGGCSLTITSSGFAYAGGTITHDGHAIDKTHKHVNSGGAGLSGIPK